MAKGNNQRFFGYALVGGLLALLVYLLTKGNSLLHESVSASILSSSGTVLPDAYGIPQFDTRMPATVPPGAGSPLPPLNSSGQTDWNPSDPSKSSCPAGYQLWHNVADNSYQCLPS